MRLTTLLLIFLTCMTELLKITYVCSSEKFTVLTIAIAIWLRYLDFVEKHSQILAVAFDTEPRQFVEMCFKKAIVATQFHIAEVILKSLKGAEPTVEPEDLEPRERPAIESSKPRVRTPFTLANL
jgi:hypothetical protein